MQSNFIRKLKVYPTLFNSIIKVSIMRCDFKSVTYLHEDIIAKSPTHPIKPFHFRHTLYDLYALSPAHRKSVSFGDENHHGRFRGRPRDLFSYALPVASAFPCLFPFPYGTLFGRAEFVADGLCR
jgi:hypothetical protein